MKSIIDVFRMEEVSKETRAKVIIKLGRAINDQYAMNITEGLVFELVSILDPDNDILTDNHYLRHK
ncbi:hypothetical protein D0T84_00805 [Dysgonomonas sp. 521]|uniref:hypothetical protein n=1 Tax=Dysgonomonas sp. 521 TaxID=2302932 RepID=UPI0013CF903A|nr:hypothetical protein [Dysgonomonas sp. 521]NDV93457.1 hypothetical protein [Dysgonomonas sp. 521]